MLAIGVPPPVIQGDWLDLQNHRPAMLFVWGILVGVPILSWIVGLLIDHFSSERTS